MKTGISRSLRIQHSPAVSITASKKNQSILMIALEVAPFKKVSGLAF